MHQWFEALMEDHKVARKYVVRVFLALEGIYISAREDKNG